MSKRNKEAKNFFSKEAKTYYEKHYGNPNNPKVYPNLYLRHRYILDLLKKDIIPKKTKVLDIGCGSGIMTKDLVKKGCEVWAVDISQNMLNASKKTIGDTSKAHYSVQDIEKLDLKSDFFDIVIASGVIEYLKEDNRAINEIKRVLKKNGVAIVTVQSNISIPRWGAEIAELILPKSIKKKIFTLDQHRRHNPIKLNNDFKNAGLIKENYRYFHFYPLIIPFDRIFPRFCVYFGKKMESFSQTIFGLFLATGYILKVRKK